MASATKAGKLDDDDGGGAKPAAAAPKPRGVLMPMLGSALIAAALVGGVCWFLIPRETGAKTHAVAEGGTEPAEAGAEGASGEALEPALYLDMTPAFVVNLSEQEASRFLQVEVQLMARDEKSIETAKENLPRIRNALLMLFAQQQVEGISTREGREKLQKDCLAEVQRALREEKTKAKIQAVYFTAFVMQ